MSSQQTYSNAFAVFTATGRILSMLCSFVMPLFLTRFLTKEDYGVYAQFYTLLLFMGSIAAFGMQSNLYYFYPRSDSKGQKTVLGNTISALFAFAGLALLIIEIPFINQWLIQNEELKQYLHLIGICIFLYIPSNILFPLFVIRKEKALSVIYPPLEIILKVILVITAALYFGTLKAIFISIVILQALILLATIIFSLHASSKGQTPWVEKKLLKEQLSYVIPFGLSVILFTVFRQFDKILCIRYISPEQYAIYSLAFFGIPGIQQIYDSVCEVNLLNMTKCYKDGDIEGTLAQYKRFCTKMFSFTVPLIFIVCVFSKEIIVTFFTEKYLESVPYFQVYIFSFLIGTLGAGTILRATGYTKYTLRAYLYSLPFYALIAYFGIKYYGLWGAMATALCGIILPKCIQIYFEINVLKSTFANYMPWKEMWEIVLISLIGLIPVIALHLVWNLNIILCVLIAALYIIATYGFEISKNIFMIDKDVCINKFKKYGIFRFHHV